MTGKVYLVGAGPGDPELLTVRAFKLLKSADVVLHDDLIRAEILALVPSSTQLHNVGKRFGHKRISQEEISALMIRNALLGLQVVRLKSGDPLIFGRAGEEIEALRRADIEFEVVPGITAALGAAASAQIPLTHRQVASAIVLVTGHQAGSGNLPIGRQRYRPTPRWWSSCQDMNTGIRRSSYSGPVFPPTLLARLFRAPPHPMKRSM